MSPDPGLSSHFSQCGLSGDEDFALMLDNLGAQALREGDYDAMDYLWTASDWHHPPSEGTVAARLLLLSAALTKEATR